jgi:hypothetical protein
MTIRRAMVALVAASAISSPAARAEEPASFSRQEQYDQRFIGFNEYGVVDPDTRAFRRITEPYEGKYKKPIEGADFYRLVGRDDLAQEYTSRLERRNALMITGCAIAFTAVVATSIMAVNSLSNASCDMSGSSSAFAQCASAQSAAARSGVITAAVVGLGGLLVGGGFYLSGAATNPNPVDDSRMRELADQYNRQLRKQLEISVVPLATPDNAGVALNLRF